MNHTAIHEAGHAAIAAVLGLWPIGSATITGDHDSSGHYITADPYHTVTKWEMEGKFRDVKSAFVGRILVLMAGAESEVVFLGECAGGDESDRHEIAMMFHSEGISPSLEPKLRGHVRALLKRHSAIVREIAQKLLAEETIEGTTISLIANGFRSRLLERLAAQRAPAREQYRLLAAGA